jgi:hypothetical protein
LHFAVFGKVKAVKEYKFAFSPEKPEENKFTEKMVNLLIVNQYNQYKTQQKSVKYITNVECCNIMEIITILPTFKAFLPTLQLFINFIILYGFFTDF